MNETVALSGLAGGLIAIALAGYADRVNASRSGGGWVMHFSTPARVAAMLVSVGVLLVMVVLFARPENWTSAALKNGLPAFAIVMVPGFWFLYDALTSRVIVGPAGLDAGGTRVAWSEVQRVRESSFLGHYIVEGEGRRRIRVSHLMVGQAQFAQMVLEHVDGKKIECRASLSSKTRR